MFNAIKFQYNLVVRDQKSDAVEDSRSSTSAVSDSIRAEIDNLGDRIYRELTSSIPNGAVYGSCVDLILEREFNWATWKKAGCPVAAFKEADSKVMTNVTPDKKSKVKQEEQSWDAIPDKIDRYLKYDDAGNKNKRKRYDLGPKKLGDAKLNILWNRCGENAESLHNTDGVSAPIVDEFLEDVYEQAGDKTLPESEKMINDEIFQWKALRLLRGSGRRWPKHSMSLKEAIECGFQQKVGKPNGGTHHETK